MANGMDDFLDFWESITNTGLKLAEYQNSKSNSEANREMTVKLEEKKLLMQQQQDDLNFQKRIAMDLERDNEVKLKDSINELELWNVNAETAVGLPSQYQTDDARKIFTEMGLKLNSDLTVGYNMEGTTKQLLARMNKANEVQTSVIANLDGMLGEIYDSQQYLDEVAISDGFDLIPDIDDIANYINSNPIDSDGNFIFPKDDPRTPLNEGYLADAFSSDKMLGLALDPTIKAAKLQNSLMAMKYEGGNSAKKALKKEQNLKNEIIKDDVKSLKHSLGTLSIWEESAAWNAIVVDDDRPLHLLTLGKEFKADKIPATD